MRRRRMGLSHAAALARSGCAIVVGLGFVLAMFAMLAAALHDGTPARPSGLIAHMGHPRSQTNRGPAAVPVPKRRSRLQLVATPTPPKPKVAPAEERLTGQVVETARPQVEEHAPLAQYLGRYDMRVAREVKARSRRLPSEVPGRLEVAHASKVQSPQSTSPEPTRIPERAPLRPVEVAPVAPQAPAHNGSAPTLGTAPAPPTEASPGSPSPAVVRRPSDALLLPATSPGNVLHNLQALAGSPGTLDYLPDVDELGDTNLLNTRKFRYWDFFQRVKDRVAGEWEPGQVWSTRDPSGVKYGVKDRLTVLRVTLDPEGALKRVAIARRSGLEFLDEEAERAFAAAGPFPNPPVGLRNDRGEIEFQFGFMFEIATQKFRFQRLNP